MAKLKRAWRWCKGRGWIALLVLAAAMIIFRLAWGRWVERQLAAKLADLRSRSEPVALTDVSYPPLSDANNAWKFQLKAIYALTSVDSPRCSNLEFDAPPYPPAWFSMAAASEQANAPAFALVREARAHPAAQFRKELVQPWRGYMGGYLNQAKRLTNIMVD